jgi:nitroreductase/dihydropteridine reductase
MNENIIKALKWRYATKIFNPSKKVSPADLHTILESAQLSPSSSGLEMWKFLVIENPEIRTRLREVSFNQPKITDASHLIVITHRTDIAENACKERIGRTAKTQNQKPEELDSLKNMIEGSISGHTQKGDLESWIKAQTYIPLGIMTETAALLGIDNCAMEGFSPDKVDEILGLKEKNLKSITMLTLGYRGPDPMAKLPKTRREFNEVVEFI